MCRVPARNDGAMGCFYLVGTRRFSSSSKRCTTMISETSAMQGNLHVGKRSSLLRWFVC